MVKYSEPAETSNLRRHKIIKSIIHFLTEQKDDSYPRWFNILFFVGMLTFISQGATFIVPLMWLGVL